jgi:hypothetical protein
MSYFTNNPRPIPPLHTFYFFTQDFFKIEWAGTGLDRLPAKAGSWYHS